MIAKTLRTLRTLTRSRKVLRKAVRFYRRRASGCTPANQERIETLLHGLHTALTQKDAAIAERMAGQLQDTLTTSLPRSSWDRFASFAGGLGFAILVAIAVRQMWFELYNIPTGSMRPTIKEGDYVVVSKTSFGVNAPLRTGHFLFDPKLVERGAVTTFTSENMDMPDDQMLYFYVIPGKKQLVKRLVGKPGDTLYFYGGQIYGVNARGRDLTELREPAYFQDNEHIPFIRFEGKVEAGGAPLHGGILPSVTLYQMNQPVAKLGRDGNQLLPRAGKVPLAQYSDLWGFKNFAMSRLLTKQEAQRMHPREMEGLEPGILYLELNHHPSLNNSPLVPDERGLLRPGLSHSVSLLPLKEEHLDALLSHMTTGRFDVRDEKTYSFGHAVYEGAPDLPGVPDGLYEFQNGEASRVSGQGFWGYIPFVANHTSRLAEDHPLLRRDPAQIQKLYNFGTQWHTALKPSSHAPLPNRYAYFRGGDLCLMGAPVMKKGDPLLTLFLKREYQRQLASASTTHYIPFEDSGPPLLPDGTLDVAFIKQYGLTIPEKMYLMLGDNHAMSSDSRDFGFVPQGNLRGTLTFHFWPPGERWGWLAGPKTPLGMPTVAVWGLGLAVVGAVMVYNRRKDARVLSRSNSHKK